MTELEIEGFLREAFDENYERLRSESGNALTPEVKEAALQQVLHYWRKMRHVAEGVTEAEVRLTLPEQKSPGGRRFTLEGVVDIVSDDGRTVMYDIKTHLNVETAAGHLEPYIDQLNLYAHIWQNLRGQPLDSTAIIATAPTAAMRQAQRLGDPKRMQAAFDAWDPVLEIPVQPHAVDAVVNAFGQVVDCIEERLFSSPSVEVLMGPVHQGARRYFGTDVCGNCDGRFSCDGYRQYAVRSQQNQRPETVVKYYLEDFGGDGERAEWLDANLQTINRQAFQE